MKSRFNLSLLVLVLSVISLITIISAVTIIMPTAPSGTGNYGINATTETSLYSHLNVTNSTPYDSLVGYWSFDSDNVTNRVEEII